MEEYRRVGKELCVLEAEGEFPARAAAALRLLMLTGCRHNEIPDPALGRRGPERRGVALARRQNGSADGAADAHRFGRSVRVERVSGNPWVFPGDRPDSHLSQLSKCWLRVRKRAGIEDVKIHDLRHSFASRALALGESLSMIGRLLGHTDVGSTARYAHLARDTEKSSAAKVGRQHRGRHHAVRDRRGAASRSAVARRRRGFGEAGTDS